MSSSNRVLVADDHALTREGLSLAVRAAMPGATVSGVGTVAEAAALLAQSPGWRMIVIDLTLPDAHGLTGFLTLQSVAPTIPIVIVSVRRDVATVDAAMSLGVAAFLTKSSPLDELASELRAIDSRGSIPRSIDAADDLSGRLATLTSAQRAVLVALAGGRSNKQIAQDRGVTVATIKAQLTAVFRKLEVTNRRQARLFLSASGTVSVPAPPDAVER